MHIVVWKCEITAFVYCRGFMRAMRGERRGVGWVVGVVLGVSVGVWAVMGVGGLGGAEVMCGCSGGMFAHVCQRCRRGAVLTMCGAVGLDDVSPFEMADCDAQGRVVVWSTSWIAACMASSACCCWFGVRVAMQRANSLITSVVCSVAVNSRIVQCVGTSS